MTAPKLGRIIRTNGVAGQVRYSVAVTYPGEQPMRIHFVSSVYGGPVTMIWPKGQTFVTEWQRFGPFGPEWVRRFFTD